MSYVPRLKGKYKDEIINKLKGDYSYKSIMEVPKLQKIVISQGLGSAVEDLTLITGQRAIATYSKKDVSNFKLRKGMPIGTKVTLRGDNMYEFLNRFISVSLPRTRDFKGVNAKGFDGRGNFNMGIKEHIIYPEIDIDKVSKILGMDITFVTTANTDEEAKALLVEFGFPFTKN